MNIFHLIKRMLHMGDPKIELVTRDSEYYPSDLIRGELLITAPDYRRNIKSITLSLKEFWIEYLTGSGTLVINQADRYRQHDSITLAHGFVFLPGVQHHFPFEMRLPRNCMASSEKSGWRLGVAISTFGPFVSRADFNINVQLSKVLQTILRAIERDLRFVEIPRGRKYIPDFSATRFIFRPPEHLQNDLQYLELDISLTDEGGLKGNVLFKMNNDSSFSQFTSNSVDAGAITNILSNKLFEALGRSKQK